MKLLLDANISWRLLQMIMSDFEGSVHVDQTSMQQPAKDTEIWNFALQNDYTILTNDEDFFELSLFKGFPPKIILLRTGNVRTKALSQILIHHKQELIQFYENEELGIFEIF